MADENKKITEIEDSLASFAAVTGAEVGSDAFDNGDEFKHLYKGTDGKTRKGMVASRHDDTGAVESYVDNETGNIGINKVPINNNHAVRVVDLQTKANKTIPATVGNLAGLGVDGDLVDSGKAVGDLGGVVGVLGGTNTIQELINAGKTVFQLGEVPLAITEKNIIFKSGVTYNFLGVTGEPDTVGSWFFADVDTIGTDSTEKAIIFCDGSMSFETSNSVNNKTVVSNVEITTQRMFPNTTSMEVTFDLPVYVSKLGRIGSDGIWASTSTIYYEELVGNPTVSNGTQQFWKTPKDSTKLETVAVDGTTVTGDGTSGNPLTAVGGGGNPSGSESKGSDNINASSETGDGTFKETIMGVNSDGSDVDVGDGAIVIDTDTIVDTKRSMVWYRTLDGVRTRIGSLLGDVFLFAKAQIAFLGVNIATIGSELICDGKAYFGIKDETQDAAIIIGEGEALGLQFTSQPNPETADGEYTDSGTTQNSQPIYENSVTPAELIYQIQINADTYWVQDDSLQDGPIAFNSVKYRHNTPNLPTPQSETMIGIFGNANATGAVSLTSSSEDGMYSKRFLKLNKTAAEIEANSDPEDIVNVDYVNSKGWATVYNGTVNVNGQTILRSFSRGTGVAEIKSFSTRIRIYEYDGNGDLISHRDADIIAGGLGNDKVQVLGRGNNWSSAEISSSIIIYKSSITQLYDIAIFPEVSDYTFKVELFSNDGLNSVSEGAFDGTNKTIVGDIRYTGGQQSPTLTGATTSDSDLDNITLDENIASIGGVKKLSSNAPYITTEQTTDYTMDRQRVVFGEEYSTRLTKKYVDNNAYNAQFIWSGDSTTAGDNAGSLTVDVVAKKYADSKNILTNHINRGHSGETSQNWIDTRLPSDISAYPNMDVYVTRWGINDGKASLGADAQQYIANMDAGLATLRAFKDVDALTILVMAPSSVWYTADGVDSPWFETIIPELRKICRKHQAVFFDTYYSWQDAKQGVGKWMDNINGGGVHPDGAFNLSIISKVMELFTVPLKIAVGKSSIGEDITANKTYTVSLSGDSIDRHACEVFVTMQRGSGTYANEVWLGSSYGGLGTSKFSFVGGQVATGGVTVSLNWLTASTFTVALTVADANVHAVTVDVKPLGLTKNAVVS